MPNSFTGQELFTWLGCLLAVLMLCNAALTFWNNVSGKPRERAIVNHPLEVKEFVDYVAKHDFESALHEWRTDREKLQLRMGDIERNVMAEVRKDIGELHEKINGVDRALAANAATTNQLNQAIARMDAKLDTINNRS